MKYIYKRRKENTYTETELKNKLIALEKAEKEREQRRKEINKELKIIRDQIKYWQSINPNQTKLL